MGETEISWTHKPGTIGRTWNPVQGCRRISPGCERCYAERLAARFAESGWSQGLINLKTRKWNGNARLAAHKLDEPLRWRQPSTVFVNSMSDLFYDVFTNEQIAAVFGVMAACPQHTFQILTKRAKRMREWFAWLDERIEAAAVDLSGADCAVSIHTARDWARLNFVLDAARSLLADKAGQTLERIAADEELSWPLPSVWLGVSVENQDAADERIPELLATPAAVRFLSCEPLIGEVRLHEWLMREHGLRQIGAPPGIRWCIAGCESGPGARECKVEWLRLIRDLCAHAGVAFFLKQAEESVDDDNLDGTLDAPVECMPEGVEVVAISKRKGRGPGGNQIIELPHLDGVQHAAFPVMERP